jgi:hypothetical protein
MAEPDQRSLERAPRDDRGQPGAQCGDHDGEAGKRVQLETVSAQPRAPADQHVPEIQEVRVPAEADGQGGGKQPHHRGRAHRNHVKSTRA